ncbi:MAG TPA: hypothetical protein VFS36_06405 [Chitinophagaceae bacterium]|nr:hypothetical protein [Chitinophagaceae bacterium]
MKKLVLILLILPLWSIAQTTLYLSNTSTPPISPAFNANWVVTTGADRMLLSTTKDGSTMTSKTTAASGASGGSTRYILNRQYITAPLQAQTIAGGSTIRISVLSSISSTGQSSVGYLLCLLSKVSSGGTVTFLQNLTNSTNSFTTTLTNRTISTALGEVTLSDGDRLIVEIGWHYSSGSNTTRTGTQSFGADNASDLPNDNTTTSTNNPVIIFSQTLNFQTGPAPTQKGRFFKVLTD